MIKEFEGLAEKKERERKARAVAYCLAEIKEAIEGCMVEEIDLMPQYPAELINALASLHKLLVVIASNPKQ